jgi:site-specific DNA recombinase
MLGVVAQRKYVHDPKADAYEDYDSVSATSGQRRPEFERLLTNLDRYDVIIVYRLDRICRSVHQVVALLAKLADHNVALVSATESWVDTSTEIGKAFIFLAVMFAQMEVDALGERVANAQNHMLRNGRNRGGKRPYGFAPQSTRTPNGHVWAQVPEEVERILEAVAWVMGGKTMNKLCTRWTEEKVPTPKKENTISKGRVPAWQQPSLKHILTNPILMGHVMMGNDVVRDADGEPIVLAEPILEPEQFYRLKAKITDRDKGGRRQARGETLLSGVARCQCGGIMKSGGVTYRCENHDRPPAQRTPGCPIVAITRKNLDEFVLGYASRHLSSENLARAARQADVATPVVDRSAERAEVNTQLGILEEDRRAGLYNKPKAKARYQAQYQALVDKLDELDEPVSVVGCLSDVLPEGPVTLEWLIDAAERDVAAVRELLAEVFNPDRGGKLIVGKGVRGRHGQVASRVSIAVVRELRGPERSA